MVLSLPLKPKDRIIDYHPILPKVLVCSKCKKPVHRGFGTIYGCDHCDMWTSKVEWKEDKVLA